MDNGGGATGRKDGRRRASIRLASVCSDRGGETLRRPPRQSARLLCSPSRDAPSLAPPSSSTPRARRSTLLHHTRRRGMPLKLPPTRPASGSSAKTHGFKFHLPNRLAVPPGEAPAEGVLASLRPARSTSASAFPATQRAMAMDNCRHPINRQSLFGPSARLAHGISSEGRLFSRFIRPSQGWRLSARAPTSSWTAPYADGEALCGTVQRRFKKLAR